MDSRLPHSRDRFGNARGGDAELARRIGEGEADLRDQLDGQGAPHGGDLAPAAPLLELHQTDPGLPAPPANEGLCRL